MRGVFRVCAPALPLLGNCLNHGAVKIFLWHGAVKIFLFYLDALVESANERGIFFFCQSNLFACDLRWPHAFPRRIGSPCEFLVIPRVLRVFSCLSWFVDVNAFLPVRRRCLHREDQRELPSAVRLQGSLCSAPRVGGGGELQAAARARQGRRWQGRPRQEPVRQRPRRLGPVHRHARCAHHPLPGPQHQPERHHQVRPQAEQDCRSPEVRAWSAGACFH